MKFNMITIAKKISKKLLPSYLLRLIRPLLPAYSKLSFSQEGEDMILSRIFDMQEKGFYVDIGAHHPYKYSNTFYFYRRGWNGINVDAMPGSMEIFNNWRPRDINIEMGVGLKEETKKYCQFDEPALNGFDLQLSSMRIQTTKYKIIAEVDVQIQPLKQILDAQMPENTHIDFMSIDVEGMDLDVLKSNDWDRYRPTVILAEALSNDPSQDNRGTVSEYLKNLDYTPVANTVSTCVFKDNRV